MLYKHSPCCGYRFVIEKNVHKEGCHHPKQVKGGNYRLLFSGLSDGCCCQEADEYKQLLLEPSDYRRPVSPTGDMRMWIGLYVHRGVSVSVLRSGAHTVHTATHLST